MAGYDNGKNALARLTPMLRPFDPRRDNPQDVGLGGQSTEYLITGQDWQGNAMNYPSIWYDADGTAHLLDEENALAQTQRWEAMQRQRAPRYENTGQAVEFAQHRSANGGASTNALFGYRGKN